MVRKLCFCMLLQVGAYDTSCCSATHCCKYTVCEQEGKLRVDKGRGGGAVVHVVLASRSQQHGDGEGDKKNHVHNTAFDALQ